MKQKFKAGRRPDRAVVHVTGYEEDVRDYVTDSKLLDQLKKRVEKAKQRFRSMVRELASDSESRSFSFVTDGTEHVKVTLPNVAADGNRVSLSPERLEPFLPLGIDNFCETTESYVLTGAWAQWLGAMLQQWEASGVLESLPKEGLTKKLTTRLSELGVYKLEEIAKAGGVLAAKLLDAGVKAASVSAKE